MLTWAQVIFSLLSPVTTSLRKGTEKRYYYFHYYNHLCSTDSGCTCHNITLPLMMNMGKIKFRQQTSLIINRPVFVPGNIQLQYDV